MLALATSLGMAHAALAADAAAAGAPIEEKEVSEVVVTAVRGQAAEVAPVKSSLAATEPQAVITRKFIEEWAPRVGDFTTSSSLAPSMVSAPNPNGPGATDGAKIAMRGFQDGEFNITYDSIPWGDTNGPSHHANSFFPSSTIGGIVIDRGPGSATDIGQASFGGSLNLYSLPFEDHWAVRQTATAASFGTYQSVTTLATGPVKAWHDANLVLNFMEYTTDGYLTNSPSSGYNQFIKFKVPVTDHFSVTALYTRNYDDYYKSDSGSPGTVADNEAYGKRFALGDDPTLQNYWKYNYTTKQSDFGYIRENADFGRGFSAENTSYTYWYTNSTQSGNSTQSDLATVGAGGVAKANMVVLTPQATYPAPGKGYTDQVYGLPGYLKRNEYRVRGDVLRLYKDTDFGRATVGAMYEMAQTQRSRFDIDLVTRRPDYREKAPLMAGPSGCGALAVQANGACETPLNINYDEYSGWHQYQVFGEFAWRPIDGLTITPGVKYVHFQLYVAAPEEAVKGSQNPSYNSATYTKTLPYLTVNYHFNPHWSAYLQYAQGFLVPDISSFYVMAPSQNKVVPQESTNYQIGTVYSAGRLTFDADVYYIDFKHKIQTLTVEDPNSPVFGETYETNSGGATYYGVEGEATYVLPAGFSVFGNFSTNTATGKDDAVNPGNNGSQLAQVPYWTSALGVRFERHNLIRPDDDLVVAVDGKEIGPQYAVAASGSAGPTAKLHAYGQADMTTTYKLGNYAIEFQVLNLGDSQSITAFKGKALRAGTNLPATTVAQGGAANVLSYQVGRSYQVTLKAAF